MRDLFVCCVVGALFLSGCGSESKDDTRVFRQFSDRSQVLLPCELVEP